MEILGLKKTCDGWASALVSRERDRIRIESLSTSSTLDEGRVVTGLEGVDIFIRKLFLPLGNVKQLYKALPFQIESVVPFEPGEYGSIHTTRFLEKSRAEVMVYAYLNSLLEAHIEEMGDVDPEWISCEPQALFRFARFVLPEVESLVVCHVEEGRCTVVLVIDGEMELAASTRATESEMDRILAYCESRDKLQKSEGILFTGLAEREGLSLQNDSAFSDDKLKRYAIPIGLALDVLAGDERSVQLREKEWTSPRVLCKSLATLGGFLAAASLLIGVVGFTSMKFIQSKRDAVVQKLDQMGERVGVEVEENLLDTIDLIDEALENRHPSANLEKRPLLVSQVLSWLDEHEGLKGKARIDSLSYALETYPNLKKPTDPFLLKLDVLLYFDSQTDARDFHEKLMEDPFVDGESEIFWNRESDAYRLICHLKV